MYRENALLVSVDGKNKRKFGNKKPLRVHTHTRLPRVPDINDEKKKKMMYRRRGKTTSSEASAAHHLRTADDGGGGGNAQNSRGECEARRQLVGGWTRRCGTGRRTLRHGRPPFRFARAQRLGEPSRDGTAMRVRASARDVTRSGRRRPPSATPSHATLGVRVSPRHMRFSARRPSRSHTTATAARFTRTLARVCSYYNYLVLLLYYFLPLTTTTTSTTPNTTTAPAAVAAAYYYYY